MSDESWKDFVHTGPGTIAGRYLRTFWQPIARAQDLAAERGMPIHTMSEAFTLFRGKSGSPYLVDFRCAHRGTQLNIGWIEGESIRCRYHGWLYDGSGQCIEQPGEDPEFCKRVRIKSYPCQEYLGLVFAYLGEGDPPPMRRFPELEGLPNLEVGQPQTWPCNYFSRVENDPGHVPFTHRESTRRRGWKPMARASVRSKETEFGIRSVIENPGEPTQYIDFHMPNVNQVRGREGQPGTLFFRMPVDDTHSISFDVGHLIPRNPDDDLDAGDNWKWSETVLAGQTRLEDIDIELSADKLFWMEDYVTHVGQGAIPPRAQEHLGLVDESVVLKRMIWEREMRALAEGRSLKQWTELRDLSLTTGSQGPA